MYKLNIGIQKDWVLSCRLDSITFSFIPRLENVTSDSLAKAALSHSVSPLFGG